MNNYIFKLHFLSDEKGKRVKPRLIECNNVDEFQKKASTSLKRSKICWSRVYAIQKFELQGKISGEICY